MRGVPVIVTNQATAELVRESATAFVATKILFHQRSCGAVRARGRGRSKILALALGLDKKIAPRCLQPGAGMGGVFAESDMDSLAQLAQANGVPLKVLGAARDVNHTLADPPGRQDCPGSEFSREQGRGNSGTRLQAEYEFGGGFLRDSVSRNAGRFGGEVIVPQSGCVRQTGSRQRCGSRTSGDAK